MAWSTPLTAVANATLTAAQWNASVRDNLLMTAPALASAAGQIFVATAANTIAARTPATASVLTSETTASAAYVDLTTPGPAVTVTSGTKLLISLTVRMSTSNASYAPVMGFAISGATTQAPTFDQTANSGGTNAQVTSGMWLVPVNAGSNTVTAKYTVVSGGATGTFSNRYLTVIPL
jgi:hypothetical protein